MHEFLVGAYYGALCAILAYCGYSMAVPAANNPVDKILRGRQ